MQTEEENEENHQLDRDNAFIQHECFRTNIEREMG